MLISSFVFDTLRGIVLASTIALLTACGGSTNPQPAQDNPSSSSTASSVTVVPRSSVPASSNAQSSVASSSASSLAPVSTRWILNSTTSHLNFVSAKNISTLEVHHFTEISGDISSGTATLVINLNSVNTGIALRDQRLRDLFFETMTFPATTAKVMLPPDLLHGMEVGAQLEQDVTAELDLHGIKKTLTARLSVQKLSSSRVVVQTIAPVLVNTSDYALSDGVEALRAAVGIASITSAVPVDFTLVFDAR